MYNNSSGTYIMNKHDKHEWQNNGNNIKYMQYAHKIYNVYILCVDSTLLAWLLIYRTL